MSAKSAAPSTSAIAPETAQTSAMLNATSPTTIGFGTPPRHRSAEARLPRAPAVATPPANDSARDGERNEHRGERDVHRPARMAVDRLTRFLREVGRGQHEGDHHQ